MLLDNVKLRMEWWTHWHSCELCSWSLGNTSERGELQKWFDLPTTL